MTNERKSLVHKPSVINTIETNIAKHFSWHPNVLSSIKLFILTPIFGYILFHSEEFTQVKALLIGLFLLFCLFDYLDGIIAREKGLETKFGRLFDRFTDYPLLLLISWYAIGEIPTYLIATKVIIDLLLFIQYAFTQGTTENRIRTTISYTVLLGMLAASQKWGEAWLKVEYVEWLLYLNILFSLIVILYNAKILQKRFIADTISGVNLLCGLGSIYFAYHDQLPMSLLLLILGGLFDGLDGAAARKWGGTRWGVYSDDIADGVNYGIAPGFALYFALGSDIVALSVGLFYTLFTLSRLVYFTLNKDDADPAYFSGVPSTAGGFIVLSSLILFVDTPVLVGLMVGIAAIQMVSFDTHYKHLGRAFSEGKKRYKFGLPLYSLLLIIGAFIWGINISVALLLALILAYGFMPFYLHFKEILKK